MANSNSAATWVGLIFLMVAVSVITRALENFFVPNGCCESECIVRRRPRPVSPSPSPYPPSSYNIVETPRPPDIVITPPPSPGMPSSAADIVPI